MSCRRHQVHSLYMSVPVSPVDTQVVNFYYDTLVVIYSWFEASRTFGHLRKSSAHGNRPCWQTSHRRTNRWRHRETALAFSRSTSDRVRVGSLVAAAIADSGVRSDPHI